MKNQITIREALTEHETALFREQLYAYFVRDIFPEPESEDRDHFLGSEYRTTMQKLHEREQDKSHYLVFIQNGQDIGFALPVIYHSEDGKCFIMEFCVYPEQRGQGTGRACAKALLDWAWENGAQYAELNYGDDTRRAHFWQSVGFVPNGADEWGEPLMLLPPRELLPFTVELLDKAEDWQLLKLENGFRREIGEELLPEERQVQLQQAIREGQIHFFVARRSGRAVGMCSVTRCFSTFACSDIALFDDFYVEPVFRKQGLARRLTQAAQSWCRENGISSLTVTCAPCDEAMYRSLGFSVQLGTTLACLSC